jgi:hypothetical protein
MGVMTDIIGRPRDSDRRISSFLIKFFRTVSGRTRDARVFANFRHVSDVGRILT